MTMKRAAVVAGLAVALAAIVACAKHGKYTQEFLDEAERDRLRMRGAMQYDTAVQQFESGEIELALSSVESSISLAPDNAKGYLLRARILLEQGNAKLADASLVAGGQLDPADPVIPYYRGIALERLGRHEDAIAAYERASALDPGSAAYRLAVAETMVELDRLDEVQALLTDAMEQTGSNPAFPHMIGHVALLQGRPEEAIQYLAEAAFLRPDDTVLREDLCYAQIAAGRFAQAEATLRRLLEDDDNADRLDLRHLRAACLIQLDRPIEARSVLFGIIRSDEGAKDVEAWVKLIDVALMLRDDGLLQTAAYRLVSAAPARHEGYLAMALWQRRSGDLEGAMRSLDRAIKRAGDDPTPRRLQTVVRRQLGGAGGAACSTLRLQRGR
jgi:predicted Zn-dependent protease